MLEVKFYCNNFWGYKIYRTKGNTPIVHNGDGFYTLADMADIDSDPCCKLKDDKIKIVNEFSNNN